MVTLRRHMEEVHAVNDSATHRRPWLDSLLASLALVGFLGWFGWDWGTHHRERTATSEFTFPILAQEGMVRVNDAEFYVAAESFLLLNGIAGLEQRESGGFRHALGPATTIAIWSQHPRAVVTFNLHNILPNQRLEVLYNGETLEKLEDLPDGTQIERHYDLTLRADEENRLTLRFAFFNHHGIEDLGGDPRPIAATFDELGVTVP